MSSSIFGAEQRIGEPLSALAVLTGRHREKKHPRPCFSQKSMSQRNQRVNDIGKVVYNRDAPKVNMTVCCTPVCWILIEIDGY